MGNPSLQYYVELEVPTAAGDDRYAAAYAFDRHPLTAPHTIIIGRRARTIEGARYVVMAYWHPLDDCRRERLYGSEHAPESEMYYIMPDDALKIYGAVERMEQALQMVDLLVLCNDIADLTWEGTADEQGLGRKGNNARMQVKLRNRIRAQQ